MAVNGVDFISKSKSGFNVHNAYQSEPAAASSRSPNSQHGRFRDQSQRGGSGGQRRHLTSLQCIDQIKEALQLQKRKKNMIFFHLHFKFVNFYQSSNDYVKCYFVIFFVHNTRTIDFQIYNIHNFLLKQSRFFFFFSGYTTAQLHGEHNLPGPPPLTRKKEFCFLFFLQNKQNKEHAHAETHTTTTNATQG